MPYLERDGASIYYEEHGSGFPLLLLAPGGLNSSDVNRPFTVCGRDDRWRVGALVAAPESSTSSRGRGKQCPYVGRIVQVFATL